MKYNSQLFTMRNSIRLKQVFWLESFDRKSEPSDKHTIMNLATSIVIVNPETCQYDKCLKSVIYSTFYLLQIVVLGHFGMNI